MMTLVFVVLVQLLNGRMVLWLNGFIVYCPVSQSHIFYMQSAI